VAQAALGRSAGEVVLHPVADEQFISPLSRCSGMLTVTSRRGGEHLVETVVVPRIVVASRSCARASSSGLAAMAGGSKVMVTGSP
jgi:hypothetical protein